MSDDTITVLHGPTSEDVRGSFEAPSDFFEYLAWTKTSVGLAAMRGGPESPYVMFRRLKDAAT